MIRRALVTNDDGIDSEGLHRLALMARSAGLEVVVAAPAQEASGSSASLTTVQRDGRVIVERRDVPGLSSIPAYAVSAAPAYITLVGVNGAFGEPPDIVLSGVNQGLNTGRAILHSGTVGAALTAVSHGLPAFAVSMDIGDGWHWDTAISVAAQVFDRLLGDPQLAVCNLNVPNLPAGMVNGLRRAPLASFGAVQTTVTESGGGFLRTSMSQIDPSSEPDSDAGLVAQGFATVTFLGSVCESPAPRAWETGRSTGA